MKIKPAPGLSVRDPATMQLLPPEGITVEATDLHWARALRDGDVVEVSTVRPAPKPKADPKPKAAAKAKPAPTPPAKSE